MNEVYQPSDSAMSNGVQHAPLRVNLTRKQVADGVLLQGLLESEGGKVLLQTIHERYAEYLADILNEQHNAEQMMLIRCKIIALLDVVNDIGIKINNSDIERIQRAMAKRHISEEMSANRN